MYFVAQKMGWERRGNFSYYYRKRRVGSRVQSTYVGRDKVALAISDLDAMQRQEAQVTRKVRQRELIALKEQDLAIEGLCQLNVLLTEAALIAAGFHIHHRQWRRKRDDGRN